MGRREGEEDNVSEREKADEEGDDALWYREDELEDVSYASTEFRAEAFEDETAERAQLVDVE